MCRYGLPISSPATVAVPPALTFVPAITFTKYGLCIDELGWRVALRPVEATLFTILISCSSPALSLLTTYRKFCFPSWPCLFGSPTFKPCIATYAFRRKTPSRYLPAFMQ